MPLAFTLTHPLPSTRTAPHHPLALRTPRRTLRRRRTTVATAVSPPPAPPPTDQQTPETPTTPTPSSLLPSPRNAALIASASLVPALLLLLPLLPHSPTPAPPPVLPVPPPPPTFTSYLLASLSTPPPLVASAMALSAFTQALSGFGFAIVSVGILTQIPWIAHSSLYDSVQPVAASIGTLVGLALLLPDLPKLKLKPILPLLASSFLTAPLGAALASVADPHAALQALGALILGFVAFSVSGLPLPKQLGSGPAAWLLGAAAGALGGAFDMQGPPLVVYGEAKGWKGEEFRRNVLAVVTFNSAVVVLVDAFMGKLGGFYVGEFVKSSLPAAVVAVALGRAVANKLDAKAFKAVVMSVCGVMGAKLLLS